MQRSPRAMPPMAPAAAFPAVSAGTAPRNAGFESHPQAARSAR